MSSFRRSWLQSLFERRKRSVLEEYPLSFSALKISSLSNERTEPFVPSGEVGVGEFKSTGKSYTCFSPQSEMKVQNNKSLSIDVNSGLV